MATMLRVRLKDLPLHQTVTVYALNGKTFRQLWADMGAKVEYEYVRVPDPPVPEPVGCPVCDAGYDHYD